MVYAISPAGLSGGLWRSLVRLVLLLVFADACHQVAQVGGGECPVEWPGGLVVAIGEGQQGPGQMSEAVEVVTEAWPRWSEPLSAMTKTRGALVYSGRTMTWAARSMNGLILW